jgi:hypothetical protein
MESKQGSGRKGKSYGPNIVRAWFDTVFHFALSGLESERSFLVSRNWTFRFRIRALEYLSPLAEHLPAAARENLEQFKSFFPKTAVLIREHDSREQQLKRSCSDYLDALLNNTDFQKVVESVAEEAPGTLGREFNSYFGGYSSETASLGILAEYVVNNVGQLANHYSTAELWNSYRERFLKAASTAELAAFGKATERSGHAMLQAVNDLTSSLKNTRAELSLEFDVPYVATVDSIR